MAVTLNTVLENTKDALEAALPALVTAEGLTAIRTYRVLDMDFDPLHAGQMPILLVELAEAPQDDTEGARAVIEVLDVRVWVVAGLGGSAPESAMAALRGYGALIRSVLETASIAGVRRASVQRIMPNPVQVREGPLLLIVSVTAKLERERVRGDA